MQFRNIYILLFVSILTSHFATAQQIVVKKDSTTVYKDIETYAHKSKFTKFVHRLVFKPVKGLFKKKELEIKGHKNPIQKPYNTFEGKTIRHINIETLDPFGYAIENTQLVPHDFLSKTGNNLHIKTQQLTIRNLLLFRKNQAFNSLLVKESERLVRGQRYIRDVSFFVKASPTNSDSVDIFIRELDNWSFIPKVATSSSRSTIDLTEKNFLGLGHEFQNSFGHNKDLGTNAFSTTYSIPNYRNTFVNSTLHYKIDGHNFYEKRFTIDRPFFSPLAKWAAGVNFTQEFRRDSVWTSNSLFMQQRFKFNTQDYWAGNAIRLFKNNSSNFNITNFITTARFLRIRYLEKPLEIFDTKHRFTDENLYLTSIGISTRNYVQDNYIFKFGVIEDVPIGKVFSITGGYQEKNNTSRYYLGAKFATGNYFKWGYFSTNVEYGTYIRESQAQQGVISVGTTYFTDLFEIGKWKFRQFVKPQLIIGLNRFSGDSLTINDGYGIDGFNSIGLKGSSKLLFTVQTQAYAPMNLIGFRFAPYLIYSFGMLGNAEMGFKNSKVYSQIGLGVLIKNENLILNTFQLSVAFYPSIPGKGQDIFKMNSFRSTDFGFRDFEIG
ncbi:MAG: hypothetical protein Q7U08_06610, partial [Flavobacteriaceae bacterium]|nr:hypothetical protein [Flavobacteriaceae bacterium]